MRENANQSGSIGLIVIGAFLLIVIFGAGGYFLGLGKQFIPQKAPENVADTNDARGMIDNSNYTYTPPPILQYKSNDVKEYLVVIGGNVGDRASDIDSISNTVEMYDPISDQWQSLPSMLYPRARATAVTLGSKIFVFGGAVQDKYYVNKAEMFNREANKWYEIAAPPGSSQVSDFNAFAWGDKIYLVYSYSQDDFKSYVYTFNIQKNSYTKYSPPPKAVTRCFLQWNEIYCFIRDDQTSVLKYSVKNDKWESISIENRQIVEHEVIGDDNAVYTVGLNNYGSSFVRFDTSSAKFVTVGVLLDEIEGKRLHAYDLGVFGSNIVIIGGQTENYVAQKVGYVLNPNQPMFKLPDMTYARSNTAVTTLPLSEAVAGGSIKGRVLEKTGLLPSGAYAALYKLLIRNSDGSLLNKKVASQFIDSDGVFEFTGLDEGEYHVQVSGPYGGFTNTQSPQEYIKINNTSKIDNLNITVCQTLGSCLSN